MFTIRQPSKADSPRIAALHVATWREAYSQLLPADFFDERQIQERRAQWERDLSSLNERDSPWNVRVARAGHELIGFAMAGPALGPAAHALPRERQLYSLYLLADWHGSGAGQALLDAVLNGQPALLWVAKENPRAIAFYRRNGFEFNGVEQTDPRAPGLTNAQMSR